MPQDPIRPTDAEAITLAKSLIQNANYGALAFLDPETRTPTVTRVAIGTTPDGVPLTLISDLSAHTKALRADSNCGLLLGEPNSKGDPLTHPRISVQAVASFVDRSSPEHEALRGHYLSTHPKSKLYIDFADFSFVTFKINSAALNGGFGKAYHLTAADLS
ncbi:HugZ family protein [Neptunicoccus cionae]|uniref:HugZ family pyridoxamine 5'-phosphate oxidase n=1 Tax=Neptunicoccus cionae TaxID=2035344 RepID=UPI000C775B5B|nr:pyridoxamine 5'-phosphate oxidase family protein [Amylibacter cionae]PLS21759.1 pyridoxamine 5-phosphate oxidase [Amylibacter cionae]